MNSFRSGDQDQLDFERALESHLDALDDNPHAFAAELLRKFPARRQEIDSILAVARGEHRAEEGGALPPLPLPQEINTRPANSPLPWPSQPFELPMRIGAYELVEKIGDGGMGSVFRARQREPIERDVAIKIIRDELAGTEIFARFHHEQRSLARMNHPHVATVLDSGATCNGRPFFVMELVHGVSLTEYCQSQQLSLQERLQIFLMVCQGIEHAHQKGVIHGDIKPSNILIGGREAPSLPKIIDFGLATVVSEPDAFSRGRDRCGRILGTLHYMSPEQAHGLTADVDPRSDIFALGVLLFELLTEETPLEHALCGERSLAERLRVVRQQQAVRPSDRLRQLHSLPRASHDPQTRGGGLRSRVEPRAGWIRRIRGDLDALCVRAMAANPRHRYPTVAALIEDVERLLCGQPLAARPPWSWSHWLDQLYRHSWARRTADSVASALLALTTFRSSA
ncbi:MAG: serine/threonine protein kinase [Planctomycetales bacterium]|nr:serine/threonine protein kinase [Planctomycetales bacterium]